MKHKNTRTPAVFTVGCALLCLTLFSANLTSGLYARYTTTATGSDSARVARFDVKNAISSANADIQLHFYDPDRLTDTVVFTVTSGSEVSVKYSVTVTMPDGSNAADWLEVKLDNDIVPITAESNTFTFSDVGSFSPNDTAEKEHKVTFTIKADFVGKPGVLKNIVDGGVTITVHAEQID